MTTAELDNVPVGSMLYQAKTTGRLIVVRTDSLELKIVLRALEHV